MSLLSLTSVKLRIELTQLWSFLKAKILAKIQKEEKNLFPAKRKKYSCQSFGEVTNLNQEKKSSGNICTFCFVIQLRLKVS